MVKILCFLIIIVRHRLYEQIKNFYVRQIFSLNNILINIPKKKILIQFPKHDYETRNKDYNSCKYISSKFKLKLKTL